MGMLKPRLCRAAAAGDALLGAACARRARGSKAGGGLGASAVNGRRAVESDHVGLGTQRDIAGKFAHFLG